MVSTRELIARKKQQMADKAASQKKVYRFRQKVTTIRILPSWRPEDHEDPTFFHEFGQTWIKDMDGKVLAVVGDRKLTYGEDDTARNLIGRAIGLSKSDAQRKHFKDMYAKATNLVNALILDDKDVDPKVPELVGFSETQFGLILDQIDAAEKAGDSVLDLNNGFDIEVTKTGTGFETKYSFVLARRPSKVDPDVMKSINDIDAYIRAQFADGERAENALKSLMNEPEPLALVDRSTDLTGDRTISEEIVDNTEYATYEPVEVEQSYMSEEEVDSLFDTDD